MNAMTKSQTNASRRRVALFGAIALAIMLGAMAAWLAPHPAVASVSTTLAMGSETDRRPGPPGKRSDDPGPSPSASTSPVSSASPSSAPAASTAPSAAPSSSAWSPTGIAPAGWQTYRGHSNVPFSIYYPAGWAVDEADAQHGYVYFYAPGVTAPTANATWMSVNTTGVPAPNANLDVLRDQYYKEQVSGKYSQAAVQVTRNNLFSGITFAAVGASYNEGGNLCYAYLGVGLKSQVPWSFRLNSPYNAYDQNASTYFSPMLNSLNIYGNP